MFYSVFRIVRIIKLFVNRGTSLRFVFNFTIWFLKILFKKINLCRNTHTYYELFSLLNQHLVIQSISFPLHIRSTNFHCNRIRSKYLSLVFDPFSSFVVSERERSRWIALFIDILCKVPFYTTREIYEKWRKVVFSSKCMALNWSFLPKMIEGRFHVNVSIVVQFFSQYNHFVLKCRAWWNDILHLRPDESF